MSSSVQNKAKRGIVVTPFTHDLVDAVKAFNARLRAGEAALTFPETAVPEWLPKVEGRQIYQEYFLAVERDQVRGAYILKHQPFFAAGEVRQLTEYRLPLSEGQIDKRYASVGVQIYLDVLRKQRNIFTVGLGGYQEAAAQMLVSAGWKTWPVPFYFRVFRSKPFLRNIVYLRTTPLRRWGLDALASSGLGSIAVHAYQSLKSKRPLHDLAMEASQENTFGAWADEVWEGAKSNYSLVAVRDSTILNLLYPASDVRWIRLKVKFEGKVVGWAVLLNVPMQGHNYFGNMRVGSLVDCLALPGMEDKVIVAATRALKSQNADILVTNLSHRRWRAAAEANGLCLATSNFIFAASQKVAQMVESVDAKMDNIHMTRGDGGGPLNLLGRTHDSGPENR